MIPPLSIEDDIKATSIIAALYEKGWYEEAFFGIRMSKTHPDSVPGWDTYALDSAPNGTWYNSYRYLKDALAEFFYLKDGGKYKPLT